VHRNYLKEFGFLTNWKKERYIETSLEKSRRILDSDVSSHDIVEGEYMVISQTCKILHCTNIYCKWSSM
jgi:hypothetical protein